MLAPLTDLPVVEHAKALPPGRLPYRQHRPLALLHTIQTIEAYEELQARGVLRGWRWLPDHDYALPYTWMLQQFRTRVAESADGLIWLWARTRRRDLLRNCRHGVNQVLLTCAAPRERLLLSDFADWHNVLNPALNVPRALGETDDEWWTRAEPVLDAFEDRHEHLQLHLKPWEQWPRPVRSELEKSWTAIFDPTTWHPREAVQAVTHELHAEEILSAVRIGATVAPAKGTS